MTDYRAVLTQALKALEQIECYTFHPAKVFPWTATITALRAALAQQEQDWSLLGATQESLREHQAEIQRLRAAPAAEQQEPEPVPFAFYDPIYRKLRHNPQFSLTVTPTTAWQGEVPLYLHPPQQEQQEPVCPYILSTAEGTHHCSLAAEPPRRKPLTEEQIEEVFNLTSTSYYALKPLIQDVRKIEQAHGIGEE